MNINPIAQQLNSTIKKGNSYLMEMLSKTGRRLFFPKGILSQSAEARQKAYDKFNATIGIATDNLHTMHLPSIMNSVQGLRVSDALTYAPSFGIPGLRQAWKDAMLKKNPTLKNKTISLPIVTNGITHGISAFADMFIDPDDVLIFPDKMWGNNNLIMCIRKDAEISQYPLFSEMNRFNIPAFEKAVRQNAENNYKIIVFLNFPNNPTGYTPTEEEGNQIADVLTNVAKEGTNVIAVTDDAYFGLRYESSAMKESLFSLLCDRHPRMLAVKLDGATKEMFVWGLRVGFITYGTLVDGNYHDFYDALERKTAADIRGSISNASHLSQSIVLKSMLSPDELETERAAKVQLLKNRAVKIKEILKNPKYDDAWEMYPFNSGYFMCLKLKSVDAEELRVHILDKYKVGTISINQTDLRIAFSCVDEENLAELFDAVYQGVKDLESKK
jgi:aspartate/methionine/tyrosine aminotransferase